MTIQQLIDQLADLGQSIGLQAPVKTWNLTEEQQPLEPLGVRPVADVCAGWDRQTEQPIATLRLC